MGVKEAWRERRKRGTRGARNGVTQTDRWTSSTHPRCCRTGFIIHAKPSRGDCPLVRGAERMPESVSSSASTARSALRARLHAEAADTTASAAAAATSCENPARSGG